MAAILSRLQCVKPERCHDVDYVVTASTTGCYHYNLWWRQSQQNLHYDSSQFPIFEPWIGLLHDWTSVRRSCLNGSFSSQKFNHGKSFLMRCNFHVLRNQRPVGQLPLCRSHVLLRVNTCDRWRLTDVVSQHESQTIPQACYLFVLCGNIWTGIQWPASSIIMFCKVCPVECHYYTVVFFTVLHSAPWWLGEHKSNMSFTIDTP